MTSQVCKVIGVDLSWLPSRRALRTAARVTLRSTTLLALMGLMFARAHAQSAIRIHMHGEGTYAADGLLYVPSGQGPFAAIILIPDERGLTRRVTDSAEAFAKAGYVSVAVDLNRGVSEGAVTRSDEQSGLDLDAALAFLAMQSNVRQDGIGAIGWGYGGISALRLAADRKVAAVVVDSIPLAQDISHLPTVAVPVCGVFPGRDASTSPKAIKTSMGRLQALAKSVTIKVYAGANSGFDDPEDSVHYAPRESADARRAVLDFFSMKLRTQEAGIKQ